LYATTTSVLVYMIIKLREWWVFYGKNILARGYSNLISLYKGCFLHEKYVHAIALLYNDYAVLLDSRMFKAFERITIEVEDNLN